MENVSKALLMAGMTLIGVMVIGIGVYLFNNFRESASSMNNQMVQAQINEFNSQFTKYLNQKEVKAHDIVSVANLARTHNESYFGKYDYVSKKYGSEDVASLSRASGSYYITVIVQGASSASNANHFENNSTDAYNTFIKNNDIAKISGNPTTINFTCTKVNINENTGYVNKIVFERN